MRKLTVAALLAMLFVAIVTAQEKAKDEPAWKCTVVSFEADAVGQAAPEVRNVLAFQQELYLALDFADGQKFGRYEAGKFVPIALPGNGNERLWFDGLFDLGEKALVSCFYTSEESGRPFEQSRIFTLRDNKLSEIAFTKKERFGGGETNPLAGGTQTLFHTKRWEIQRLYVLKDDALAMATMPDGSPAKFHQYKLSFDAAGRCIATDTEDRATVQYILEDTQFTKAAAPQIPEGAKQGYYDRFFTKNGAFVSCNVGGKAAFWHESAGKRSEIVDLDGNKLELDSPSIRCVLGSVYVYVQLPKPKVYQFTDGPVATPVVLPEELKFRSLSVQIHDTQPVLWAWGTDQGCVPFLLDGSTCKRLLKSGGLKSDTLFRAGTAWVSLATDFSTKTEGLSVVKDGEVTQLSCQTKFRIERTALCFSWVSGTLFVTLADGNQQFLCRLDGSILTPVHFTTSADSDDKRVISTGLKVAATEDAVFALDFSGRKWLCRIGQ